MTAFDTSLIVRALTGQMGIRAFNDQVRERRAAKFEAALDLEQLNSLVNLSTLESLFNSESIPLDCVDVFDDGHLMRLAEIHAKSGKPALTLLTERLRNGSTIRVRDMDTFDGRLNQFVHAVRRHFAAQSQINLYLTPPAKMGFPPHFDSTDVFVIQFLGDKHWRIFDDYVNKSDLPLAETNWAPEGFAPFATPAAMTLSPGDVLYLPRGVMHQAFCTDRESMHLTISVFPLTFADLIRRELGRVAEEDIRFRRRVPWSMDEGNGAMTPQLAALVQECVLELTKKLDVAAVLQAERRSLQGALETGATGELSRALASLREGAEADS